ncbi:hypothetical protein niasHS_006573 [Heterodera schachtii]|uniref:Uncharacterized protein n=1 Tax=Heterodera schachtii TaxID=97005 RepID=A0ABD2JHP0_HETSC
MRSIVASSSSADGMNGPVLPLRAERRRRRRQTAPIIHHPIQVVDVDDELFCVKWIIGMDERRGILGGGKEWPARDGDGPDGPDKSGRTEHRPPSFGGHFKWPIGAKRGPDNCCASVGRDWDMAERSSRRRGKEGISCLPMGLGGGAGGGRTLERFESNRI